MGLQREATNNLKCTIQNIYIQFKFVFNQASFTLTGEDSHGNLLPFLNVIVNVAIDNGPLDTIVYRKKPHSGLELYFTAMAPRK